MGGIARAVVPAAVERQEPRFLPLEVRAEAHFVLVDGEMGHATAQLEQLLAGVAVPAVLPDGVLGGLLRETVLQLEREDRQAVDEQRDVQRLLGPVAAVPELPGDGEPVLAITLPRPCVARRRRPVEQVQVMRAMPDPVAEHVDGAALRDLALEPRKELAPHWSVRVQRQNLGGLRLRGTQERRELRPIDAILAVIVVMAAGTPALTAVAG